MSRVVGIDVTPRHVRAVLLRVAYRKTLLEDVREVERADFPSLGQAIVACTQGLGEGPTGEAGSTDGPPRFDSINVVLEGRRVFVHHVAVPVTAQKQIDELLPFEIEALVPIDIDELVFDYEFAPPAAGATNLDVLTVAARTAHVKEQIDLVTEALGREPERVLCGSIELSQLVTLYPELDGPGPLALIDLDEEGTDVCIVENGRVVTTRSLPLGTSRFPDGAEALVAQLRQTFGSHSLLSGQEVTRAVLVGSGSTLDGVHAFFSDRLELPVESLSTPKLDGTTPAHARLLPRFARALGAAQHGVRGKGIDLRRGELAFQRGFGFLKEKAPLLTGLAAAVLISFVFATWAEMRSLTREREMLTARLEAETQAVFGEAIADPAEAEMMLQQAQQQRAEDPMPHFSGLAAAVAVSEAVSPDIVHDIEELDLQKGKLTLRGIVNSSDEAQRVSKALDEHRCIEGANISKITQVLNSDWEKYVLEATARCPEEEGEKKKAQK